MSDRIRTCRYLKGQQENKEFSRDFWNFWSKRSISNLIALIFGVSILPETTYSFDISATIDTKNKDAVVTVEYGLTTEYGSEIPIAEGIINGIVQITANLIL